MTDYRAARGGGTEAPAKKARAERVRKFSVHIRREPARQPLGIRILSGVAQSDSEIGFRKAKTLHLAKGLRPCGTPRRAFARF